MTKKTKKIGFIVSSSPHQRPAGEPTPACPPENFNDLFTMPLQALQELGLRRWGRQEDAAGKEFGPMLWLFPGEWYEKIPAGFDVVDISFKHHIFRLGESDNDIRFGCLPYGILRNEEP